MRLQDMRRPGRALACTTALLLAGCAPSELARVPVPPPATAASGGTHAPVVTRRAVQRAEDEAATAEWLQQAVQQARERNPEPPPAPVQTEPPPEPQVRYEPQPGPQTTPFPVGTAFGATLGAATSNGRPEAVLFGASIGLMFDLARWY